MLRESDASIVTTSYDYDSVALDAMKRWFSDMQKGFYVLGPVLPIGFGTETRSTEEGASVDIETFLGEMLLKHGKRSVFFVRFFFLSFGFQLNKKFRFPLVLSSGPEFQNILTS
jgi:hypothetical protein